MVAASKFLRYKPEYDDIEFDHELSVILKSCMNEYEFPEETGDVIEAVFARLRASDGYVDDIWKTVAVLVEKSPLQFLDRIFFDTALEDDHRHVVFQCPHRNNNLLSDVDVVTLMNWCRQGGFQERLTMISEAVFPFDEETDGESIVFSEQAYAIIDATQKSYYDY